MVHLLIGAQDDGVVFGGPERDVPGRQPSRGLLGHSGRVQRHPPDLRPTDRARQGTGWDRR